MMISSGRMPNMVIVTRAGAVSSQRPTRALSSRLPDAAWAVESGVDGVGCGSTGFESGAASSVEVISVLQHLHRLGGDAQADGVAALQYLLEAAPVLHPHRHIAA